MSDILQPSTATPTMDPVASPATPTEPLKALETPTETKPTEDPFAPKFAALARRERELTQREKTFRDRESAFKRYEESKKRAKQNPLSWLQEAGLTYEELTEYQLRGGQPAIPDEVRELQEKLQSIEADRKKELEEREQSQRQQRIDAFKGQIESEIKAAGDSFELINGFGRHDLVFDVIEEYHAKHGQILPITKAAEMTEQYLESEVKKHAGLKKMKAMFGVTEAPKPSDPQTASKQIISSADSQTRTLTNTMSQSAAEPARELSDEERRAEAARLIRFLD